MNLGLTSRLPPERSSVGRFSSGCPKSCDCVFVLLVLRRNFVPTYDSEVRRSESCDCVFVLLVVRRNFVPTYDSERMTRFELATSTLGRSRSTN